MLLLSLFAPADDVACTFYVVIFCLPALLPIGMYEEVEDEDEM
jgi:hypothetical protein